MQEKQAHLDQAITEQQAQAQKRFLLFQNKYNKPVI
jgi:hypothetical protein